jgi:hypothetical protein
MEIRRLRTVFLVKLAGRLGLEAEEEYVRTLVRTHDDAAVLVAIEAAQAWSLRRAVGTVRRWFGFG